MSNDDLNTHTRRTIYSSGFFRSGILHILAWPLLCLILAMGLWYWTISKIDAEKRACEKKVLQEASALCNDYAHFLVQAIEQANQITLQLQYGWEKSRGNLPLKELSQGGLFRNPQIVNVLILNREGMPATTILDNPQNVSNTDRDYFVYHKNDDSDTLLVGKPVVSRATGKPAIPFTRRLNTPLGAFDGVALVSFAPPYLTAFNAGSFPGKTGVLMAVGLDGTLRSAVNGNATQDPMSAVLRAVPLFSSPEGASYLSGEQWFSDKQSRYVAWKTLKEYPLVVMVGLSEQEYFAPYQKTWATDRTVAISGSIILFLFASAAAGMSARLVRKKHQDEEVRKAYRVATEGGNEGFYMYEALCDKNGAIADFMLVDCNERGAEFYGTVQMLLLQRKLSSLYPAAFFDKLMTIFRGAMVSGFYEDETRTPSGSTLQIEWAKRRLVRSGNGLAVTVQDITERKNGDMQLRKSEAKFRALFENATDGIFILSSNNIIVSLNASFARMHGYTVEELLMMGLKDLDTPESARLAPARLQRLFAGEPMTFEVEHYCKNGDKIPLEVSVNLVVIGDEKYILGFHRDITERIKAEEALLENQIFLNCILNGIPDAIYVKDLEGQYKLFNAAAEKYVGKSETDLLGKDDYFLFPPDIAKSVIEEDRKVIEEGAVRTNEDKIPVASGENVMFLTTRGPLLDSNGKLIGLFGISRDISEQKQAEDQIHKLNSELEQRVSERTMQLKEANQEMESFAYSVSHDLRAPLRSIDGFSLALLEDCGDKLNDEGKDYLRRVRAATQKMAQLIDDILKLSRVTRAELTSETVNLSALAVSIAEELRRTDQQRKVKFVIKDGAVTKGDPRLLTLVLENLLGNARKFTSGHAEARIEFGVSDVAGKTAYFVRDDGAGFDMKYVDKLFITFQRLHTELEFPGTGVGLTLVQHIIHRHGGTIWAEGAVDQGATFWFTVGYK